MSRFADCYCAFCRRERRVYRQKNIEFSDFILTGVCAVTLTLMIWQELNPKGFLLWIPITLISALRIHLRWRLTVPCPHCGFDPVLYLRDREKAAGRVKIFLNRRRQDPNYLLASPLDLPKIVRKPLAEIAVHPNGSSVANVYDKMPQPSANRQDLKTLRT